MAQAESDRAPTRRVSLISLGCPKNLVDSEGMVSDLLSREYEVVVDPADADVAIINTCGFLASAREESLATIRRVAGLKKHGLGAVLVTGCMVKHHAAEIREAVPEVDECLDFSDYHRLGEIVGDLVPAGQGSSHPLAPGRRVDARLTPAHYAYLKISEGCNHTCSFCVIPAIRGPMRSVPLEELVRRGRRLAELGAKEINVVAQDSTMYGADLYGRYRLAELLQRLADIEGVSWVRLMYAYPTEVGDDLLDVLAGDNRVLPYIDVPIQHSAGSVLERMRRKTSERDVEQLMARIRERVPDATIRTTVIVGFPGETEAEFEHLLDFVDRHRIERLGAFPYSPEPGSPAHELDGRIPEVVVEQRLDQLMRLQRGISHEANQRLVGNTIEVLVESPASDDEPARGRSRSDAPEVDGGVELHGAVVRPGQIVAARVTSARDYDLVTEVQDVS